MTGQLQFPEPVHGTVNPAAGEAAKVAGMAKVSQLDPQWVVDCDKAIRAMAGRGGVFQAADLIAEGLVSEPDSPNQWGPAFRRAALAGVIRPVGYAKSKRATVHSSICRTWTGSDAA